MSTTFTSQRLMRGALIGFGVLIILAVAGMWLSSAVYAKRDDRPIVRRLGSWLPVAKVGSRTVSYGNFLETRDTLRIYLQSEAAKQAGLAKEITKDVEENAFERLVREAMVAELAQQKHIEVTDEDARGSFAALVASTSSSIPNVAEYLTQNFHWNEEQFRAKVIRPAILEERVMATFASSTDEQLAAMESYITKRHADPDVKIYLKF